ncbi:hypothetical protein E4U17_007268 [Claviceps sp. LM77 group G4]|nr:hypothetical protein E4U17_007268 [Claviceps sp. LM77 group G4]KAG6073710.1 hypothetical protein E4U16_004529 [Claviceps sp. LM84 group G4]KAG6084927.1 hypothetical protein E4U33_002612 [Claviceps sp. LM78 group G4]
MSSSEYEIAIERASETKTRIEQFRDILKHRAWQREMAAAAGVSYWHLQPLRLEECAHLFPLIYTDEQYSQLLDDFPMEPFEVYGLWGIFAFPSPRESAEGGQQAMPASKKAGEEDSSELESSEQKSGDQELGEEEFGEEKFDEEKFDEQESDEEESGEQESVSMKPEPSATPTGKKQNKNKKAKKKVRIEKEGGWVNLGVAFKVLSAIARASVDERWMLKPRPRRVPRKRGRRRCKASRENRKTSGIDAGTGIS